MPMFYEECATPLGNLLVVTQHLGHLTHIVFDASTDRRELARAARVRANAHSREMTRAVVEQIQRYFARDLTLFELQLAPRGTVFQQRVWAQLARIPFGHTRSYGQIAATLGQPRAARAVGAANGKNPISIIIPCHRLVGSTGAMTGYAGGVAAKRWLLEFEAEGLV